MLDKGKLSPALQKAVSDVLRVSRPLRKPAVIGPMLFLCDARLVLFTRKKKRVVQAFSCDWRFSTAATRAFGASRREWKGSASPRRWLHICWGRFRLGEGGGVCCFVEIVNILAVGCIVSGVGNVCFGSEESACSTPDRKIHVCYVGTVVLVRGFVEQWRRGPIPRTGLFDPDLEEAHTYATEF